jgi:hypothetical protein
VRLEGGCAIAGKTGDARESRKRPPELDRIYYFCQTVVGMAKIAKEELAWAFD